MRDSVIPVSVKDLRAGAQFSNQNRASAAWRFLSSSTWSLGKVGLERSEPIGSLLSFLACFGGKTWCQGVENTRLQLGILIHLRPNPLVRSDSIEEVDVAVLA
jgi:hypothetical protein